jgi:hypothetical protein
MHSHNLVAKVWPLVPPVGLIKRRGRKLGGGGLGFGKNIVSFFEGGCLKTGT